jgi:hypothetical protein
MAIFSIAIYKQETTVSGITQQWTERNKALKTKGTTQKLKAPASVHDVRDYRQKQKETIKLTLDNYIFVVVK